ncbi:MAG: hypothetical protein KKI14_01380, partial [Nanoarchaeota archaeon]|nr:hypothetical protein [Nanoarchaeota archaeon]
VVVKTATLGTEYHAYGCKMRALKNSPPEKIEPKIQLTCGYSRNGERFGDPHSIVHNVSGLGWPDIMQVVGFLSIDEPNPYFARKIDQVASVPEDLWTKFK